MVSLFLLEDLLNNPSDKGILRRVNKDFRRSYSKIMPYKFFIFPQQPHIYTMSKTICIEFPMWGSDLYRRELYRLEERLEKNFRMDIHYFNGNVTFLLHEIKKR